MVLVTEFHIVNMIDCLISLASEMTYRTCVYRDIKLYTDTLQCCKWFCVCGKSLA